ncbi:hypothetical protein RhiTH_007585 [Rhizoctonia solani]
MVDHDWYPPGQLYYPPALPDYLKDVYNLKPFIGVPSNAENVTYTPPALPAHILIALKPISGAPLDDEMMKVQEALQLYQQFSHTRHMQAAGQVQPEIVPQMYAASSKPESPTQAMGCTTKPAITHTNNAGRGADNTEIRLTTGSSPSIDLCELMEQSTQTHEKFNQLLEQTNKLLEQQPDHSNSVTERLDQIFKQSAQYLEQTRQPTEEYVQFNQLFEQFNQLVEQSTQSAQRANEIAKQSNALAEKSNQLAENASKPVKNTGELNNASQGPVEIQHDVARVGYEYPTTPTTSMLTCHLYKQNPHEAALYGLGYGVNEQEQREEEEEEPIINYDVWQVCGSALHY